MKKSAEYRPLYRGRGLEIPFPPRSYQKPGNDDQYQVLEYLPDRWIYLCDQTIARILAHPPSHTLHPSTLVSRGLRERLTLPLGSIRDQVLGLQHTHRSAFQFANKFYFITHLVEGSNPSNPMVRTTRLGLLQLNALMAGYENFFLDAGVARNGVDKNREFRRMDRLMRELPRRGAPMLPH